jgi:hypothetical protein
MKTKPRHTAKATPTIAGEDHGSASGSYASSRYQPGTCCGQPAPSSCRASQ